MTKKILFQDTSFRDGFQSIFGARALTKDFIPAVEAAVGPKTALLWVESPTNPLLKLVVIAAVGEIARRRGLLLVVDNTFASPYLQRPLSRMLPPRQCRIA